MRIANEAMLAVVALFIVVAPIDADAQNLLPPTLTGENLHAQHGELVGGNIGTVTFSAGCGPNSTIDYTITGVATGPYPGPFVESGKIVLGSGIGELGEEPFPIVELSARFTIESITAVVTGSKTTVPGGAATFVICQFCGLGTCPAFINSAGFESAAELDYAATIHGDGTHSDRGTSLMEIVSFSGGQTFDENFISALAQISPGRSPGLQPGRGCGDRNHVHDRSVDCP